jgi:glycosyltransferase involved in cell wall biosynthesis
VKSTLLTVSGLIDPDIEAQITRGERPLADYIAMARTFEADLLDYNAARRRTGATGRLLEKIGGANLMLAWACFQQRRRYRVLFTDGEQVGIPLALMMKAAGLPRVAQRGRPHHLMIGHNLAVGKKKPFFDWAGVQSHIDHIFVYATWQKQFAEERWPMKPEQVVFTPFMVDHHFFSMAELVRTEALWQLEAQSKPIICSVGLEFRDYPTLLTAVRGLDVQVVIAAASPWSRRSDSTAGREIPANVLVRRFTQYQLRHLYALSAFMVMPLYNVNFQAGVTAILEAMAMEKAVLCSRTPGQTDVIREGKTGLYAPPENPQALREAITFLLRHPKRAQEMGLLGRRQIEEKMSLDCYVTRLNQYVRQARRLQKLVVGS